MTPAVCGRLYQLFDNGVLMATYVYNAEGLRSRKITDQGTTIYHYDQFGLLISETAADGALIKDYLWQDFEPVAQIEANPTSERIVYLHTDHLNTPRLASNGTPSIQWRWQGEAFGLTPAEQDVDADGTNTVINLRFAGQYYDSETGLHYNYFRDYDPSTGRYIQSDPIGLRGGLNTYAYVGGNPVNFVDPLGLARRQERPLDIPGLRNTTVGPLQHDRFQYDNGSDSGYYGDGTVRPDNAPQSLLNQYQDVGRWFDDNALQQAEQNVQNNGWFNDPYNLNPANSHQCQDYADKVEREYDRITDRWVDTRRGRRERSGWRQQWWRP